MNSKLWIWAISLGSLMVAFAEDLPARVVSMASLGRPASIVLIPAGWFLMGSLRKDGDRFGLEVPYDDTEVPQRRIWLDAYEIDRDEVSLGDYLVWRFKNRHAVPPELAQVLAATERIPDATVAAWPALYVSWSEAAEYCRAGGKRLPTEAEWEKAARGIAGQLFPWGRTAPDATRAVFGKDARSAIPPVTPVDSFAEGRSPYGLHHMAGNVAEWVQDWSGIDYYMSMPERNPPGPVGGQYKVVRGGSWRSVPVMLRTATRSGAPPEQRSPMIGFRCAK